MTDLTAIFLAARALIERHGDEALQHGHHQAEALSMGGDEVGAAQLTEVADAIVELQRAAARELDTRH